MLRNFSKYRLVYAHLWSTYGQSWFVRLGFLLRFITRICQLITLPVALSLIIAGLSRRDFSAAERAVVLYTVFSVIMGIGNPLSKYVGMLGENRAYQFITGNYFSRLVSADLDYFNSNQAGYLTTATRQYVDSCMQLVRTLRDRYLSTVLGIIFPLGVIFWLDIQLGLVALVLSITQAAYLLWASYAISPYRTYAREVYKRNSGRMADIVSNILAVKATAQEKDCVERVREGSMAESDVFKKRYTMQAKLIAFRELITVGFFLILLWLTVQRMSGGHISITAAVLVVSYTTTIMASIYTLSEDLDEHDDLVDKIMPAFEVLNREHAVTDPPKPRSLRNVKGRIEFRNVSFSYDKAEGGRRVFSNFSLTIPAGQKVGVVGLSGAGKSTLTRLLLRFNDVDAGHVVVDGIDVRKLRQADLRKHIAYVPQEPLLFHASIRENVLLAQSEASDEAVRKALKTAHALKFVLQLSDGLDSVVGERGVKLSGGQKQRIAIARAVLQGAPIVVLDEATSALDSESEQIIKDSFARVLKGKTAVVIAHRLSTLSEMDRIVVIEKGKIVEDGSHDELLEHGGAYARLWRRQQKHLEDVSEPVSREPYAVAV